LDGIDASNVIEVWKIRRIGGLSCKENLVALIDDGTHICTCIETITKGVICRHFWRVMLYSNTAKFHISIIPIRWYKDDVLMKLDDILKDSPILSAIEPPTNDAAIPYEINFTLQSLRHIQRSEHKENVQRIMPQRNRFGVAFSTAKTAINIALETKSDNELVQLLKEFISSKKNHNNSNLETMVVRNDEHNQDNNEVTPLQQYLIDETTDPHVTRIRGAPCKKRIKSAIEVSKGKNVMHEITGQINNNIQNINETSSRQQRKCLSCGKPGHYKKRCPNNKE
jgi:hypothetical protein